MIKFKRSLIGLGSVIALLVVTGNAWAQPAKTKVMTYIGTLPADPPARVAIVIEGDTFLAYACGQTDDFNKVASAWFSGTINNGRILATEGGKKLNAKLSDDAVRGSMTAGGRERDFTAKPVSPTAIAGLYRASREVMGDVLVLGWIVDAKHQVVGGCQGKKREPVALRPAKPLPAPTPKEPKPDERQDAEESLIGQFEEEPGVSLQGQKVTSAVKPPSGKLAIAKKK